MKAGDKVRSLYELSTASKGQIGIVKNIISFHSFSVVTVGWLVDGKVVKTANVDGDYVEVVIQNKKRIL